MVCRNHSLIPKHTFMVQYTFRVKHKWGSKKGFLLKAPDIRGVTLRRDSVTWSRARRRSLDGSEQLRPRVSNMSTPTTPQVGAFDNWCLMDLQPSPCAVSVLFIFFHTCTPTLLSPLAHFLSLLPVRGNRTTADLNSPVFQPSQTCQVTTSSGMRTKSSTAARWQLVISCVFSQQMSLYHFIGAKHGDLQVLLQNSTLGQSTEVWKMSTQPQMEKWSRAVIKLSSNHSFQVCNFHKWL